MKGKTYVIAEIGLNHNGKYDLAKKLVDVAADAGADCAKFQKRDVETMAVKIVLDAPFTKFPSMGKTYREIRKAHELNFDEYTKLKAYTEKKGLDFLCTTFDLPSFEFLEKLGVEEYKIASHSVTNLPLIEAVAATGKKTFLSTGAADWDDVDTAVDIFATQRTPLTVFHCVSAYPTPLEEANVKLMDALRQRYPKVPIGFSGHEMGWIPTLAAVAHGAVAVERHITLDHEMEGFDHRMSLEPQELKAMVKDIRDMEKVLGTGDKVLKGKELETRHKYHVSMVSAQPIKKGTILTEPLIAWKYPGTGLQPRLARALLGKKVAKDIPADTIILPEMVSGGRVSGRKGQQDVREEPA